MKPTPSTYTVMVFPLSSVPLLLCPKKRTCWNCEKLCSVFERTCLILHLIPIERAENKGLSLIVSFYMKSTKEFSGWGEIFSKESFVIIHILPI